MRRFSYVGDARAVFAAESNCRSQRCRVWAFSRYTDAMQARRWRILLVMAAGAACGLPAPVSAQPTDAAPPVDLRRARAERRIREQEAAAAQAALAQELPALFRRHVEWLSDPDREGRAPATRGGEAAGDYIEDAMLSLGLLPAFADVPTDPEQPLVAASPYRQPLVVGEEVQTLRSHMSFALPDGQIVVVPDAEVSAYSGSAAFTGPCTFAGYAIPAGGAGYLGFVGTEDFDGRAVLMLSHEPMDELGRSLWADQGWSFAAPLHRKINAVVRRGAGAVVVITPPDLDELGGGLVESVREEMEPFQVPVVHLPGEVADALLHAGDPEHRGLNELYRIANKQGVVVDLEGVTAAMQTSVQIRKLTSDNIGAVLPGRGELAGEFIVIGAHYDHLGRRPEDERTGSAGERDEGVIFPGADDNASGTAGLLLAAEQLTRHYDALPSNAPARSILFLAFTAEEMGLKGSQFYVEHPAAPLSQHVLMLNMDMIGRYDSHGLEVGGLESGDGLAAMVETNFITAGVNAGPMDSIGLNRSDQASFLDKKVPSVVFFTGLHDQYHTPYDTADLVDEQGGATIATLVADIAFDAATAPELPKWSTQTPTNPQDDTANAKPKVRTGVIPTANSAGNGMFVGRVLEGSAAEAAGLRPGDRITSWNGHAVTGPNDWMPLLLEHKPGDTIRVEFTRAGEAQAVDMTLQGKDEGG